MTREAMDLRVLKESSKSRFDSYSVTNRILIISHNTFQDCRVHIFSDNLSRNSCMYTPLEDRKSSITNLYDECLSPSPPSHLGNLNIEGGPVFFQEKICSATFICFAICYR